MGSDIQFYFDASDGMRSDCHDFPEKLESGQHVRCSRRYLVPQDGLYYLKILCNDQLKIEVNGIPCQQQARLECAAEASSVTLNLKKGWNTVDIHICNPTDFSQEPRMQTGLLDAEWEVVMEPFEMKALPDEPDKKYSSPDLTGFHPGAGTAFKTCGRFGLTKGDGVLDYSMPAFGIVARPFISGHPRYHRPNLWNFSLLPEGEKASSSLYDTYTVPKNETIFNDWTHVRWERRLANGKFIAFDYSLLTPSLLIESDLDTLYMSRLTDIGGFQRITLPLAEGAVTRPVANGEIYNAETDGSLTENWLLLSKSGTFPEVPVLLVFQNSPMQVAARRLPDGHLESLTFKFDGCVNWTMLQMPYGFELFEPHELTCSWYEKTIQLCRERQREMLARPEACAEYFRFEDGRIHIVQKFDFRIFEDTRGTAARRIAPIPPPLALAAGEVRQIQLDAQAEDLNFPTKYGPLYGVRGNSWSEYYVPVEPARCEIAFPSRKSTEFGNLLHQDFNSFMEYFQDVSKMGVPCAHSFVFSYAQTARLFPFLQYEDRRRLEDALLDGLKKVCDPDYQYTSRGGKKCLCWYQRTEPFSKVSYYATYLHVGGIERYPDCRRETIENSPIPMLEIDWGNAMTLYGVWLAALFTGQWEMIKERWNVFRKAFDYFLVMMDWACMTAAYCENGVTWNDGTNYGAYIAFMNLAEMTGNADDYEIARYAYAKMTAMRLGLYYSSQKYYFRYWRTNPYRCTKFFHEETDLWKAFTNYPVESVFKDYRSETLYNMTTEGRYEEAWRLYWNLAGKETREVLSDFERGAAYPPDAPMPDGVQSCHHTIGDRIGEQEVLTYLALCIMSDRYSPEKLEKMIVSAAVNHRMFPEYSGGGQPRPRRLLPQEWSQIYLLSMLYARKQPRLTVWRDLRIVRAVYPELEIELNGPDAWLEIVSESVPTAELNGEKAEFAQVGQNRFRIRPEYSGIIRFMR